MLRDYRQGSDRKARVSGQRGTGTCQPGGGERVVAGATPLVRQQDEHLADGRGRARRQQLVDAAWGQGKALDGNLHSRGGILIG